MDGRAAGAADRSVPVAVVTTQDGLMSPAELAVFLVRTNAVSPREFVTRALLLVQAPALYGQVCAELLDLLAPTLHAQFPARANEYVPGAEAARCALNARYVGDEHTAQAYVREATRRGGDHALEFVIFLATGAAVMATTGHLDLDE